MSALHPATRTETDSFGPLEVPADKYWGAQTQRSIQNFPIGWERQPVAIIRALGVIKKACALVNIAQGDIDAALGNTIAAAAQEVIDGKFDDNFPLVVWQTGSGTQSQHERQRGDLEPRHRNAGRGDGVEKAGSSE